MTKIEYLKLCINNECVHIQWKFFCEFSQDHLGTKNTVSNFFANKFNKFPYCLIYYKKFFDYIEK